MTIDYSNEMDVYALEPHEARDKTLIGAMRPESPCDLVELQKQIGALNPDQLVHVLKQVPADKLASAFQQLAGIVTSGSQQPGQSLDITGDQRQAQRKKTLRGGKIIYNNKMSVNDCQIRDMSDEGCRISMQSTVGVPSQFTLHILNGDTHHDCEVVWRKPGMMGVKYL